MNATTRFGVGCAAVAALVGVGSLGSPAALADPADAPEVELHNITYIARIDGVSPGAVANFRTQGDEVNSSPLSALPGRVFEANTVLDDPAQAGLEIRLQWPYSANVHCEITVDDAVAVQVDQFVETQPEGVGGVLTCGEPLHPAEHTEAPAAP